MAFYFTQLYGLYPIILQQIHYWLKDSKHKYDNKIGFIILFRMAKTISILVSNNNKKNYL